MKWSNVLGVILAFTIGTIFGPILIAGVSAILPTTEPRPVPGPDNDDPLVQAQRLVTTYRAHLPRGNLFTTVAMPPYGRECGYDPNLVFPTVFRRAKHSESANDRENYLGYWALHRWRGDSQDEAWIADITDLISREMSVSKMKFLRTCIESPLFSERCMSEVDAYGDRVERFGKRSGQWSLPDGLEDRTVCLFVDGVAARRGIPLSPPFSRKYADDHQSSF
ncbi:MAG: hypothetical protein ACAH11_07800 [Sphingomonas sp.]